MIKFLHINGVLMHVAIIAILANINIASGQTNKKQPLPLPENVNTIFRISCTPCHWNEGGRFPKSRLNFSRWVAYGAIKEAEKASAICSAVTKGAMPPRSARQTKPELIPSKEQIDLICKWAQTFKSKKKEK